VNSNVTDRRAITANLTTSQTYGSWDDPKIVITCDPSFNGDLPRSRDLIRRLSAEPPCNGNSAPTNVYVDGHAAVTGTGLLIVTREMELRDTNFNWRGIVLVLDKGRFYIRNGGSPDVRGVVLGTIAVQDDNGNSPKVDFRDLETANALANPFISEPPPPSSPPSVYGTIYGFGVKYSVEAIENALSASAVTLAWHEAYEGEESL
jgi:hypothetical protein